MPIAGKSPSGATVFGSVGQGSATGTDTGLPVPAQTAAAGLPLNAGSSGFVATQGWYITGGIVVSVMLANTKAGPFLLGILGLALIYQTGLLLQGK